MKITFKLGPSFIDNGDAASLFSPLASSGRYETVWALDKQVGQGYFKHVRIRDGFDIYICDYRVNQSFTTCLESRMPAFGFGFWMSGNTVSRSPSLPGRVCGRQGQSPMLYYPDQSGTSTDLKGSHRRSVSLLLAPDVLYTMLRDSFDLVPGDFRRLADGSASTGFLRKGKMTPDTLLALDQLLKYPFTGGARRLFLESKAIELIAMKLDGLEGVGKTKNRSREIKAREKDRIRDAAEFLCRDLEHPPTLSELAASAGLCHTRLNRGFKHVFGTTVFGYLRQVRLSRARALLESGDFNVTESAFAVGYNSLSSFTRAFRVMYGIKPHACTAGKIRP